MAKAKTTVVVKKSPTAAVAVNSDRFITRTTINFTLITFLDCSCIRKYFQTKQNFLSSRNLFEKKKSLTYVRPSDGEPYF